MIRIKFFFGKVPSSLSKMTLNLEFSYHKTRQALLQLHVNDQLVINCTDSCHSCLMLIIVRHEYSVLKLIFDKDVNLFPKK